MVDDEWANGAIPSMLDLIEEAGEERGGAKYLEVGYISEVWAEWAGTDLKKLFKIMAGRRLVSKVAGAHGEELREHPEARKMHEMFMQRLQAFEEEEEQAFIEEETLADMAAEGIHQEVVMPAHLASKQLSVSSIPPTPPSTPVVPAPPPMDGLPKNFPVTVASIRKLYGGDDIRVKA